MPNIPIATLTKQDEILASIGSNANHPFSSYFPMVSGAYPFNNNAADITISANTTWSDACGYKKVGVLTINAGITLTITKTPFYIFCDELVFGSTTSVIDISAPSGASAGVFDDTWARGGTADDGSARAQGGCGGGMLIIVANNVSGAAGVIKANGGNAYRNTTNASVMTCKGGQGAFGTFEPSVAEQWGSPLTGLLSPSVGSTTPATGGGSGFGSGSAGYGGSGIGSGGGAHSLNFYNGIAAGGISLLPMLILASWGCRGGGGGGAIINTTGTNNAAGGGGGGAIAVLSKLLSVTPTMQANGGTGVGPKPSAGGAGFTKAYLVTA